MTPRVLVLPSFYNYSGQTHIGSFFKHQVLALIRSGIQIDVGFVEPRSLRTLSFNNVLKYHFQITEVNEDGIFTIRQMGWNPWLNTIAGGLLWSLLTRRLIDTYVRSYGIPKIIHAHNVFWAGYAATYAAQKYNIPCVITEHSSCYLLGQVSNRLANHVRRTLSRADKVVAVSHALADSINKYVDKNISVIPNLIDTDFFSLPSMRRKQTPYVILAIANLNSNKGFDVLLRAFAYKLSNLPDVVLHIGGDGPERLRLERLSRDLGISSKVKFLGLLTRDQVRQAMWDCNLFVLSSFHETFGVVLIEALSTGVPVIATKSGGPQDIVVPEVGHLVDAGNYEELGNVLLEVISSRYDENKIREYVSKNFSERAVVNKLVDLYSTFLY